MLLATGPLSAQTPSPSLAQLPGNEHILSLGVENDLFGGYTDNNYTNGLRLSLLTTGKRPPEFIEKLAGRIPFFDESEATGIQYTLGQNLYTPDDISLPNPPAGSRPYAGYLYGAVGLSTGTLHQVDDLEMSLGVVGPSALGRQTQVHYHRLIGAQQPKGWAGHQLHDEPALNVSWQRRWPRVWQAHVGSSYLSLMPNVGFAAGNIYTHASTGATLRLTSQESFIIDDPLRVRPAAPGTGYFETENRLNWLVFVGADGRAVARNIFLDGNTFQNSPHVSKKPLVADLQAGLAFTYGRYQVGYTQVYRSKEFQGQNDAALFGALNFAIKY